MFTVNKNPSLHDLRGFGRAMVLGFGVLAVVLWFASAASILAIALFALGLGLFVLSRVSAPATKTVYIVWMTLTVPVGMVMSTILLTILFIAVLPIFSLVVRLGDPLRRKLGGDSYWEDYKPHEPTLERMRRPF